MKEEYKPIGSDAKQIYGFVFGMFRYQVEWFDHNKAADVKHDDTDILICRDFYDTLYGTRVYRFFDGDWGPFISTTYFYNKYIEKEDLKKLLG